MARIIFCSILLVLAPISVDAQRRAPSLVLKDLQGHTLRLSDYKGKVVLINFWATWCPPCLAEMPELIKWQREHRGSGLQIIGITYPPEQISEVRRFIKKLKVNYPIVMGARELKAQFDESETLPLTVVIDRAGIIREVIQGILLPEEFAEKIKPLLQQDKPQTVSQKTAHPNCP
jgi:thiol-disulfide isomerase/thioredoxin